MNEKIKIRISETGAALAEFLQEAENALKVLKLETDIQFIEGVKKNVQGITDGELKKLEEIVERTFKTRAELRISQ